MKKKNGFTLIELLAVIIILGVLMLVAIPSVTSYINNSRKSAYADTAANYIKGATNLVNEGQKVQMYSTNVLYLIPVGHDTKKSCVSLESGGQSPYNNEYALAYVGVTYNNEKGSYTYYFTAVDGSGQGLMFNSSYKISGTSKGTDKKGADLIEAGLGKYAPTLKTLYGAANATSTGGFYCVEAASGAANGKCVGTGSDAKGVPAPGATGTDSSGLGKNKDIKEMAQEAGVNYIYVYPTDECDGTNDASLPV